MNNDVTRNYKMSPNPEENQYLNLLTHILKTGHEVVDRTGVGTRKVFDSRLEFDLSEGRFPLLTTKYTNLHGIDKELEWFLSGSRNARDLVARGCNIWSNWIKPCYSFMNCSWLQRPYIHYECNTEEQHEHYHRFANGACVPAFSDEVLEEMDDAIGDNGVDIESGYWKRQMEYRARRSMQKNDPSIDRLFRLWMVLLTEHTFPALMKPEPEHNGQVLCQRWLEFEHFFEDVQKLPNYQHFVDSESDGSVCLTGIYDLDPILRPETAVFMNIEEYRLYEQQEQEGLWKVTFQENDTAQKPPAQYYLQEEDTSKPSVRMVKELYEQIENVDRVSMEGKPWRLRMAKSKGELGPVYGFQWRDFNGEGFDQIAKTINNLKKSPFSRRHVISCWNPAQLVEMALEPCHYAFQFNVTEVHPDESEMWRRYHTNKLDIGDTEAPQYKLDLKFHMRSNSSAFAA